MIRPVFLMPFALLACAGPEGFTPQPPRDASIDRIPIAPSPAGTPCAQGTLEPGEPGAGCAGNAECLTPMEGYPGGYCAPDCRSNPCAVGEECVPLDARRKRCFRLCSSARDCRYQEGYACRAPSAGARPVCLPDTEPLGRREDGTPCFVVSGGDAGVGVALAPLPQTRFGMEISTSRGRGPWRSEAEPALVLREGRAVVAHQGYDDRGTWRIGVTRTTETGALLGNTYVVEDRDFPDALAPALAMDPGGRVYLGYIGNNTDRPGNAVRVAYSDDGGETFSQPMHSVPNSYCQGGCPEIALAIAGTTIEDAQLLLATVDYVRDGRHVLVARRGARATGVFPQLTVLADTELALGIRRVASFVSLAANARNVFATWVALDSYNALALLGTTTNRIRLRRSGDAGQTWDPIREVARMGDAPVGAPAVVAAGNGVLHVAYVTAAPAGRWSVILATSTNDGASFNYRVVNDDPEPCATHALASLAGDPATNAAHVGWVENRFGDGAAVYARCSANAAERCERNVRASTTPFVFTTSGDTTVWLGTRTAMAVEPSGRPWFSWTDTRSGGPGVYLARGL